MTVGTLKELNVQPGDMVQFVEGIDGMYPDTVGKYFDVSKSRDGIYVKQVGATDRAQSFSIECTHKFAIVRPYKMEPEPDKSEQFYVDVQPGYQPLASELYMALEQSQGGKGKERHANGKPFLQQPMMEITRMTGPGGAAYQVMKKTQEAVSMANRGEYDRAIAELHGAIVYAAGCAMAIREKK